MAWGKCIVCGREDKYIKKGMCSKHYHQWKKYGKVLDDNPRTQKDPNEIVIHDDYAEIILYEGKTCYEVARAIIDLDDVEKVKNYKWALTDKHRKKPYITSKVNDNTFLHTLIMDCPKDKCVVHINDNHLDNRKSNLRIVDSWEAKQTKSNKNGYSGINKVGKLWVATIYTKDKRIYLGSFKTKEEAIEVRKQAEIKYYGKLSGYKNKR